MKLLRNISLAFALFAIFLLVGTIGYRVLEGWPLLDSFYMTLITLSTVGFGEIRELTPEGRIFTSILIMGGIGAFCYLFSLLTEAVVSGQLAEVLEDRKNQRALNKLENHYIVCGFGRVGQRIAGLLVTEGKDFVVVDKNPEKIKNAKEKEFVYVEGDYRDEETLRKAGITKAKGMFVTGHNTSDNIYVSLLGKSIKPNIRVIIRDDEKSSEKLNSSQAPDGAVSLARIGALKMFLKMFRPHTTDILEEALVDRKDAEDEILIEDVKVSQKCTLKKLGIEPIRKVYAIYFKRNNEGRFVRDDEELEPGDVLIIIGPEKDLERKIAEIEGRKTDLLQKA